MKSHTLVYHRNIKGLMHHLNSNNDLAENLTKKIEMKQTENEEKETRFFYYFYVGELPRRNGYVGYHAC